MEESEESKPEKEISEQKPEVKIEEKKEEVKKIEKPKGPGIFSRIKNKFIRYKRVMNIARKPERDEFVLSLKVTVAGILLLGFIGFIIFLIFYLPRLLVVV